VGVKNPKNDHKNNGYHWSLFLPEVTLLSHLWMVKAVFRILNPHWFKTLLSLFPTFCICDWPNSLKPSCITNTFSSTMSFQHPLEPVWFSEVEVNCVYMNTSLRIDWTIHNILIFTAGVVSPLSNPKLENHLSTAVCDCLFNIFSASSHIWRQSCPLASSQLNFVPERGLLLWSEDLQ